MNPGHIRSSGSDLALWLIVNVPPWLLLSGLIVLIVAIATITGLLLRRHFPQLRSDEHNDALRFTYGVVGFVYAFFVGFVANGLWSEVSAADALVRTETAAAVQIARDRFAFDQPDADRVLNSLRDYAHAARAARPIAALGKTSPEVDSSLKELYRTVRDLPTTTQNQQDFRRTMISSLDTMSSVRTQRLMQATTHQGANWPLWLVVLVTSGLVLAAAITFGVESQRLHHAIVLTVSVLVAVNIFLVLDLSYPYLGDISTPPYPEQVGILYSKAGS